MRTGSRLVVAALALTMSLQPVLAQQSPVQYFRLYGNFGPGAAGGAPIASSFSFDIAGPAFLRGGQTATFVTTVHGAHGAVAFDVASGALPPGAHLDPATGAIGGVVSQPGNYSAVIHARDADGRDASRTFSLAVIEDFLLTGSPAPVVTAGTAYQTTFLGSGGGQPYSFEAVGLPPGTSLSSAATTATVAGTPTVPGEYDVLVRGSDAYGQQASVPFHLSVTAVPDAPLQAFGSGAAFVQAGAPYSATFTALGGHGAYSWSLQGAAPDGISMDPASGVLSGSPSAVGTYPGLVAVVTDEASHSASTAPFALTVFAPLQANWNPAVIYQTGDAVSATASATGGNGTYSWSVAGQLPTGVTLNASTGAISGHATVAGSYGPVSLTVSDGTRTAQTAGVTFVVSNPPPLAVPSPAVADGQVGQPFAAVSFAASGGHPGYTYSVSGTSTALPPGMSIDANGTLSGTPTDYYDQTIRVVAADNAGATASSAPFRLHVFGPLALAGTPQQFVNAGDFYQATEPHARGGTETGYVFDLASGEMPDGLSIDPATGIISGVPTTEGSHDNMIIRVTDSAANIAFSPVFSIVVQPGVNPVSGYAADAAFPLRAVVGIETAFTVGGQGGPSFDPFTGVGNYMFSSNPAKPLPPGLTIDPSTGVVSGTPTVAGVYAISAIVTDVSTPDNYSGYANLGNLVVSDFIVAGDTGYGNVDQPFSLPFTVTGGSGNVTFSLGSGSFPAGLTLDPSTGEISGTPTEAGTWSVTVMARDNVLGKSQESNQVQIQISAPGNLCYAQGSIGPGAEIGLGVMSSSFVQGGLSSSQLQGFMLNWTDTGHAANGSGDPLPPGVSWISANGFVVGAPAPGSAGTYGPIVVTVKDNQGGAICGENSSSQPFAIEVRDPVQITTSALPDATAGVDYSATIAATGGKPGYWFSLAMDQALPPLLVLDQATGTISGVTSQKGTFPLDVTVTDAWGFQSTVSLSLTVR